MRAIAFIGTCIAILVPRLVLAAAPPSPSPGPAPDERAIREACSAFSQAGMRAWQSGRN